MNAVEDHPFKAFVPANANKLIIGSFPGRQHTQGMANDEAWFYGAKRNQFWQILSAVFEVQINKKTTKQQVLAQHQIAITDIFLKVRRKSNNNLDENLELVAYNDHVIRQILAEQNIQRVFFTSKLVGKHFNTLFPEVAYVDFLPSPSPRFVRMSLQEKVEIYREKLLEN
ncbi:uracil-DNA glycosylase family protein [Pelobium manganitolerans]|uniref:uracil-DNA glycosylase family protein n=1 Tax=Pelobium manganitolerans TaxID=1842495 RepID=UPI003FA3A2DB